MANFLNDTFTEASATALTAHTPDTGGAWVANSTYGATIPSIVGGSGTAAIASGSSVRIFNNSATPATANYSVTASVKKGVTADIMGVAGRASTYGVLNCITGYLYNGNAYIQRYGGAGNSVLSTVAYAATSGTFYAITLELVGTSITLKVNGAVVSTVIETSITAAGTAALFMAGTVEFDSISAGDVATAASTVTMSGPTSGAVGFASTNFTVGADAAITGTVGVTPSDAANGGTFTPTTVSISSGTPTATFTYTPASTGAKTISVTNDGSLTNPSNITYTASAATGVPTLTDLTNLRVFQRISGEASIPITGTYTGTPTTIEARIVQSGTSTEVVAWTTIAASPSGSVFSGSLTVPQGGWYNVQVRDSGNTGAPSNGSNTWGVGDIYVIAGQSNGEKMFSVGTGTPSSTTSRFTGAWGANAGAGACAMANALTAGLGVPVAMIGTAVSGSGLYTPTASAGGSWDNPATTPYTTWASRVSGVGGKIAGVFWLQGEWDASIGITKANYKTALLDLIARMRTATSQATLPFFIVPLTRYTGSGPDWNNVQDAFMESYSATVPKACDTWDLPSDDGLHYNAAGQVTLGGRLALAARKYLGQSVESLGPVVSGVAASGVIVDVSFTHLSGTDITPSSAITGMTFTANGSSATPTSVVRQSANVVRATFASSLATPVYAAVAVGTNPDATAPLKDSAGLPAQRTATAGVRATAKTVSMTLTTDGSTPAASLTGLKWAFFDGATPDVFAVPVGKGTGETTDASGVITIPIGGSALAHGGVGWLIVTDSDGTTTQSPAHKAFSGPASVTVS